MRIAHWLEHLRARRWLLLVLLAIVAVATLDWGTAPPPVVEFARMPGHWASSDARLYDRDGHLLDDLRVNFAVRRLPWVPLTAVSADLRDAVVRAEDHRFYAHGGVDWLALAGSVGARLRHQHPRGASTITMQTAAYLWPAIGRPGQRGWIDKLRQMRAAWALESRWTKDQILEAYLNLAPFQGETQGAGAGALVLFGKAPAAIDRREAAVMAARLPDPAAPPATIAARACRMVISADCAPIRALVARADDGDGGAGMRALDPALAPHLAQHLLLQPGQRVTTTLDSAVQAMATVALRHQLQGLGPKRARDGAVVVVDNISGDVLAYVGGVGLGSTAAAVDGASALRQAGSTLKPQLYAQLIERKWLTSASILDDSPVQLDTASGLYVPRDYDNSFKGPVSVRNALANSLNVPAVRALLLDGVQDFRDRLWDLGYAGLEGDGAYYGYSLALGSAEVTLLQQANAYRTLANLGRWTPLRVRRDDPGGARDARQLIDPGAAWIIGDMLADASARAGTFGTDSALRLPFWAAAKTGTSKAMRDNWCVGFSDRYTVAVWVGNLEGDPMRAVSGTSGAAPVWRDVMIALHRQNPGAQPPRPANVTMTTVRFATGHEPSRREWFLTGTAQPVMAAPASFALPPRITNPVSGSVYAYDPDIPARRQSIGVKLTGDTHDLTLTLDGHALPPASDTTQLPLIPGTHLLALRDAGGRVVDQVRFTVR